MEKEELLELACKWIDKEFNFAQSEWRNEKKNSLRKFVEKSLSLNK